MDYLITPSLAQMMLVMTNGKVINENELEWIWKEGVVT
jgi:hypothetical protein